MYCEGNRLLLIIVMRRRIGFKMELKLKKANRNWTEEVIFVRRQPTSLNFELQQHERRDDRESERREDRLIRGVLSKGMDRATAVGGEGGWDRWSSGWLRRQ